MKRFTVLLLIVLLTAAVLPALGEEAWGQAPLCFSGEPDACYDDSAQPNGHLKINIKIVDESPRRVYFICDVQVKSPDALFTAFFNDRNIKRTGLMEKIAAENGAMLAINCDFCGDHDSGVIIRNGKLYRAARTSKLDLLIVDKNGDFHLRTAPIASDADAKKLADQLISEGVLHTMEFGPALVEDGQPLRLDAKTHVISTRSTQLEPRTGIGQIGPLHYVIIVGEGRRDGYSKGFSLQDFQQLFIDCGARTAMNLDGGGSAKLYFYDRVINRPSSPSRQVSDALIFR